MMIQPLLVFSDIGLFILRLALAAILIIHGIPKIKNRQGISQYVGSLGFKPAIFWGTFVAIIEFFGGLFLLLGLFSQIVSFFIALQFLIIIFKVNLKKGFVGGYEFDLLILASSLVILFGSGGAYSLDRFFGFIFY